ncbi:MAG: dUTP diphosphatase [Clostridiaceae bacterium]|nr:dUTP diphosphatase [Clostridiaceae bacterium]
MGKIDIKIKYLSDKIGKEISPPFYASDGAAGMDLSACIDSPLTIYPRQRVKVPCGIALAIPKGYVGLIYARSGLGANHGITLPNCVGVIDSDYRGEIMCALTNIGDEPYTINPGDRICQIVFTPIAKANLIKTDDLDDTGRSSGGFGSTGLN